MNLRFVTCHQPPRVVWTCISSYVTSLHAWYELAFRHMSPASTRGMNLHFVTSHQPPRVVWTCISSHVTSLHTWYELPFRHMSPASTRGMNVRFVTCHQPPHVVWTSVSSHAASLHTYCGPAQLRIRAPVAKVHLMVTYEQWSISVWKMSAFMRSHFILFCQHVPIIYRFVFRK